MKVQKSGQAKSAAPRKAKGQRRRTVEEREIGALQNAIVGSALDCIIIMDHEGKVVEFNPAAEKTFGYSRAGAIGKPMAELIIPPALRERHRKGLAHYLATGEGPVLDKRIEMTAVRADGTEFPVELTATRIRMKGEPIFCGYVRDITARKQAAAREAALREINAAVTSTLDPHAVVKVLLEKAALLLPYAAILARVANRETGELEHVMSRNIDDEHWKRHMGTGRGPITKRLMKERAPVFIPSLRTGGGMGNTRWLSEQGYVSLLAVPMVVESEILGVITFLTEREYHFAKEEIDFLSTLASQAAIAIRNAHLHADLAKKTQELSIRTRQQAVLTHLGNLALAGVAIPMLLDEAALLVARTLRVEYCRVLELLPDGETLLLRAGVGWQEGAVGHATVAARTNSPAGYALLSDGPVVVEDLRAESRFSAPPLLHEHGVTSGMSVIIRGKQRRFGVLDALATQRRTFTQDDIHFLQSVANLLATAIEGKRMDEALRDSEERHRTLFEGAPLGLYRTLPDGKITDANPALVALLGYPDREELLKVNAADLYVEPQSRLWWRSLLESKGVVRDFEVRFRRRDGATIWAQNHGRAVRDAEGKVIYFEGAVQDITERRRLEKEILEISEKERFRIGQDLHDNLGQHLTGIALMAKGLEQKLRRLSLPESDEALKIASLVGLAINQTRGLARGLFPVELETHGLGSALTELAVISESLFNISCVVHCDKPLPVAEIGGATHLYRIAQEAVDNAVKHGRARSIRITLTSLDGGGLLSVSDDGAGFSGAAPEGMGLRIMKYRSEMIRGSLDIRPGERGGTVVTCSFPLHGEPDKV